MSIGLTLVDSAKLSQDMLQKGVILTVAKNSPVLEKLPFMEIVGNGYSYNLVDTMPTVGFRAVNSAYAESGAKTHLETENLVILGGDVDVDRFIAMTRGNINDIRAIQTELKAKATAMEFEKKFFKGDKQGTNEFDGLITRLKKTRLEQGVKKKGTNIVSVGITLDALNELLDAVENGADVLYMNKKTRRDVMSLLQESNHYLEVGQDAFGRMVTKYGDVEIRAVEGGTTILEDGYIVAVKFGAEQYVCGLTNGGMQVMDIGQLETKPVYRTRIEWYVGLAVFHPQAFAVLSPRQITFGLRPDADAEVMPIAEEESKAKGKAKK